MVWHNEGERAMNVYGTMRGWATRLYNTMSGRAM